MNRVAARHEHFASRNRVLGLEIAVEGVHPEHHRLRRRQHRIAIDRAGQCLRKRVARLPAGQAPAGRESCETLAQRGRTTPFVVLLTAFALLLQRWSGQGDLRIGVPVANRTRAETEGLIGLFEGRNSGKMLIHIAD